MKMNNYFLSTNFSKRNKQAFTQRKDRGEFIRVSLVGYTNVGKSTLLNLLSKSDVLAENKLFATLDSTVRKVVIAVSRFSFTPKPLPVITDDKPAGAASEQQKAEPMENYNIIQLPDGRFKLTKQG